MATVGSVYAKAVFEMAQERGQVEGLMKDLSSFNDLLKSNAQLTAVLAGAGIDPATRKAILADVTKATGVSGLAQHLLELLSSRNRLSVLPTVVQELQSLLDQSQGVLAGEVHSAVELSQEEVSVLEKALAKRVGKKVRLAPSVDPSLLGGMVATVGGKTFDASLRSQLNRFKNELL